MNYAIILAGGIGTRFWPLSRELEPKQFLNVCSSKSMIEETVDRISRLIKNENIYIATSKMHNQKIKKCLKTLNISLNNILFEPMSKNTLAPIAILSKKISNLDSDAVIVVLPSDHFIKDKGRFLRLLSKGIEIARIGYIVSLGIHPQRPETGYGYIKTKSRINGSTTLAIDPEQSRKGQKSKVYKVDRFIEKPNLSRARKFSRDKRYYWNSGIFIFRTQVMLEEIKKFLPYVYKIITQIKNKEDFKRLWHRLPCISVDYAIMEKTKRMALLPADCGWLDLGSWESVREIIKEDKHGNIFQGKSIDIGSKNTLVWSDKRLITTLGLDNIIIVDTEDALLVCHRDKSQDVKKAVGLLKQKNFKGQI